MAWRQLGAGACRIIRTPRSAFAWACAILTLLLNLLPDETLATQEQVRATVDVVRLNVAVVHTADGVIPPLVADDFEVYDNGVRQRVRLLRSAQTAPLRVALVLDASPSLRPWWHVVQRTAVAFIAQMGANGCPYVLPFSDGIGPGRWGRYSASDWRAFIADAPRGTGTSLHDALVVALDQLRPRHEPAVDTTSANAPSPRPSQDPLAASAGGSPRRPSRADLLAAMARIVAEIVADNPLAHLGYCANHSAASRSFGADHGSQGSENEPVAALVLLSDGADTTSVAHAADVIDAAKLAEVPVFPVIVGMAARDADLAALLQEMALATGGFIVPDVSPEQLPGAYARVLGYLRSTYILTYDPAEAFESREAPETGWHEVRVELRRPLLRAITRRGYYR